MHDQPLEPLLLTNARIIFDPQIFESEGALDDLIVRRQSDNPLILRAFKKIELKNEPQNDKEISFLVIPINVPPWHSRIIEYSPNNFDELSQLLNRLQFDLQTRLSNSIEQFQSNQNWSSVIKKEIIILLRLTKTRSDDAPIETPEFWAFMVHSTIEELSIKLGLRGKIGGHLGVLLGEPKAEKLNSISVTPLKPTYALTKKFANVLSDLREDVNNIVTIGLGALGSQIVLNLARQGFGKWHLVDYDLLLPHNLSRHGLSFYYEGQNKSHAMAFEINGLLNDKSIAKWYPYDILRLPSEDKETGNLQEILSECDLNFRFFHFTGSIHKYFHSQLQG